ncbi:MAG: hypothetical protein II951_08145 [Bacteroidales bacterium]|nr:hypothetical protein [Bacteroidales bacterium]
MSSKFDLYRILTLLVLALSLSSAADAQSLFNNKLNFPKGKKLNSVSASYFDSGLIIPDPWKSHIPFFKYRYENCFAVLNDGQAGSFGIGYAAGLGMLKKDDVKVYEEERLVKSEIDKNGERIDTYEIITTEVTTTKKAIRASAEISFSYHKPIADYADVYARLHGGIIPTAQQLTDNPTTKDYITYGGGVGIQYLIKGKFGFFAEVGAGEQVFTAGIVWGSMNSAFTQVFSSFFGAF